MLASCLIQLSILFLYKRIFTTTIRWFKISLYVIGFVSILICIAFFFSILFACTPLSFAWNKSIPGGHCINIKARYVSADVLNLATDIAIVVIPIPLVWRLQMNVGTKLAVVGMFLLGGLLVSPWLLQSFDQLTVGSVIIINLIRLPQLLDIGVSDLTCKIPRC